jgi:hypothetical protein
MTAEHLYRILLKAYPTRYRREYEQAMAQCFRDQLSAADTSGKRVRLWLHTAIDLARSIPARHVERWMRRLGWRNVFFTGWTGGARRAIYLAQLEAASFNRPEIGLEHLLVGALRTDESAVALLGSNGLEEIVRALETQEAHPRRTPARRERNRIPLALDCKRALARAWEEAQNSRAKLGSRHLLRAILREDASTAARLLRERGINLSSL